MTQISDCKKNVKQLLLVVLTVLLIPMVQSCNLLTLDDEEVDVVLDSEIPSIHILNPTSEEMFVTTQGSLVVSGTAHDNKALKSVTYTSSAGHSGTATGLEDWSISDLQLAQGDNMIQVTAMDENDNRAAASITITRNKYLTFLGAPYVDNDVLYANQPQEVWITVNIAPNDHLIASSVRLIEIDGSNKEMNEVCAMYDDGDLEHGDEIKGDNVFSTKHVFNYSSEGTKRFRISARTQEDEGEVEGLSAIFTLTVMNQQNASQQVKNLLDLHAMIEQILIENADMPAADKEKLVVEWLQGQSLVKGVTTDNGYIVISHWSGLESYVLITDENSVTKGGYTTGNRRTATPALPLSKQTRGVLAPSGRRSAKAPSAAPVINNNDIIQNKQVLIWAPFEKSFSIDMEPTLSAVFNASPVSLNVDYVKNSKCTRQSLLKLNNYGIIVFDTHGRGGNMMLTGETVEQYELLTQDDIYNLFSSVYYIVTMAEGKTYYAVTAKFFKNKLHGGLPNSIIFNGSCESLKTEQLANALISRGAKTYLGFKSRVTYSTCRDKAKQFFTALTGNELKTTGQAYVADMDFVEQANGVTWHNSYLMTGSKDMRFYMGLINGDFEYGNLNGWNTSGDGRVITRLGSEYPTQGYYMGIVSTGLGYTEKYGSISQSFKVTNENTLSITWNFLSEEFLEYVGSIYQDYLRISISDGSSSTVIFSMAIDDFAKNYTLTPVSPTIVFDRGDVHMTGWKTSTFDISKYQGKTVTLTIETGDIGDSIYDSATLLDEISIY